MRTFNMKKNKLREFYFTQMRYRCNYVMLNSLKFIEIFFFMKNKAFVKKNALNQHKKVNLSENVTHILYEM